MNILFLTPRICYPPAGGDRVMVYNHLRLIAPHVDRLHMLTFIESAAQQEHLEALQAQFANLSVQGVLLPPWRSRMGALRGLAMSRKPLQVHYYRAGAYVKALKDLLRRERFDAAYLQLLRMGPYMRFLPEHTRTVLAMTDCLTRRYERAAPYVKGLQRSIERVEMARISRYEAAAAAEANEAFVVTEDDRQALVRLGAPERVKVLPLGADVEHLQPEELAGFEQRSACIVGNFYSIPNKDAVRFTADEVWPRVRERFPDARLRIIGIHAPDWMRALDGVNGIEVVGEVDDVRPYVRQSALSLCPVRIAAGTQFKVIESLALGVPSVTTPYGLQGVGTAAERAASEEQGMLVGEDGSALAEQVARVFDDPDLRMRLGRQGRAFVEERYNWEDRREPLLAMLRGA